MQRSVLRLTRQTFRNQSIGGYGSSPVLAWTGTGGSVFSPSCGSIPQIQDQSFLLGGVRTKFTKRPSNKEILRQDTKNEGIRHPGFTYFPRFPGQEEPPVEPTKLFMVKRIRSLQGCPWWEKEIMHELGLKARRAIAIMKNTECNNAKLYRVKHLVEITPITTPHGMPDNENHAFLKENGEFIAYNAIVSPFGENVTLEDAQKFHKELTSKFMDDETMKSRLRARWFSRYDVV